MSTPIESSEVENEAEIDGEKPGAIDTKPRAKSTSLEIELNKIDFTDSSASNSTIQSDPIITNELRIRGFLAAIFVMAGIAFLNYIFQK